MNEEKKIRVIIDGEPADEKQYHELLELYVKYKVIMRDASNIQHFSFEYAKRRAESLHV